MLSKNEVDVKKALINIFKDDTPRSILSDHEGAFLSKNITSFLDDLKIPLNVNATSDHHALGIIDNFARRIKTILTSLFLKNNNVVWINSINNIIRHYNNSQHSSLNKLSPNQATKEANKPTIFNINLNKAQDNNIVSDLKPGEKVRKNILFINKFSKGTDPKWSEKVFTVESVHGNTITLNDKSMYKRMRLLKVHQEAIDYDKNPVREAKRNKYCVV